MKTNTTTETRLDALCRKARTVITAGEYLPGRLHFAEILAARLESEVASYGDKPAHDCRNGRATALSLAMSMTVITGDVDSRERIRSTCRAIMGVA